MVKTDSKKSILFPGNYHASRFGNEDIPFHILKSKYLNRYDVVFKHLNEECGLLKIDYKLYHLNLLRNDRYIGHYQIIYRDFDIGKPKIVLKKKLIKNVRKMKKQFCKL